MPRLKKNLLSISALDARGMRVAFIDGQVIMWPKGKTIDDAIVIALLHFDQKSDGCIVGFSTLPCRIYDTMIFF